MVTLFMLDVYVYVYVRSQISPQLLLSSAMFPLN